MKIALILTLLFSLAGCNCTAEKNGVSNVIATQELVLPQYLDYVAKDSNLNADQRDDRVKLVDSLRRLMLSLKRSLEK